MPKPCRFGHRYRIELECSSIFDIHHLFNVSNIAWYDVSIPLLLGFPLHLSGIRGPDISCERLAQGGGVMYNGIAVGPILARARLLFCWCDLVHSTHATRKVDLVVFRLLT